VLAQVLCIEPPFKAILIKASQKMDDVAADTIAIIAKRLPVEKRNLHLTDRLEDLGIDSFSAVEMIFDLEEKFDIQISYNSNDPRPEFETVADVVEAIRKRVGGNS
jgi:acyl carrier protein